MDIKKQTKVIGDEIKKLEDVSESVTHEFKHLRASAFQRFPIIFVLLSSFGLVATFYGFEKVIDRIPFFVEHPYMILVTGVITLLFTGALYKKLN